MFLTFSSMILKFYINKRIIKFIHPLNFPFSSLKLILLYSLKRLTRYERNSQRKKKERKSYKILETLLSLSLSLSHSNSSRASPSLPSFRSFERIEKSARVPVKVGRNGDTRGEIKPPSPVSRVSRCNLPGKSLLDRNTGKYRKVWGYVGSGNFRLVGRNSLLGEKKKRKRKRRKKKCFEEEGRWGYLIHATSAISDI